MKKQTTGNFQTREGLESYVAKAYAATGQTGKIARTAGVSEHTVREIVKAATAAKHETDDCPECSVQPAIHAMVGRKHVYQCPDADIAGGPQRAQRRP